MKIALPFLTFVLFASAVRADVKVPAIFSDHLILQRGKPVPVWGWADPSEEVTVKFGSQSKKVTADKDGAWSVKLDELKASSDPAELSIKGKNEIVLKDVLVGEVWVCSGQSNMGFTVSSAVNAKDEIANSANPQIRMFQVPLTVAGEPQKDIMKHDARSAWLEANPQNTPSFTAAGYFFGRELQKELKVPIGLINTSWGGTRAEAWTSKPALEAVPTCKAIITAWEEHLKTYDPVKAKENYEAVSKKVKENIAKIKEENAQPGATPKTVPQPPRAFEDETTSQHRPAVLFNAMINPIVPYAVKGAIWYQGESNAGRAVQYQKLLPTMIKDWRKHWGYDFSFYIVQLAGFGHGHKHPAPVGDPDDWAELQWTELETAITPNFKSGLAVTNDIGMEGNIHPTNKQEVGHRLALQALVKDYKRTDLVSGGPIYAGGTKEGKTFVINFSNAQNGLKSRDGGELKGFLIAGEDKVWHTANAKIQNGKQVRVSSDEVPDPAAVRYAWESWCPEANLINKEGLPTSVFRTDKWDLSTKGIESPFTTPAAAKAAAAKAEAKPGTTPGKEEVRPALIPDKPPGKDEKKKAD
jgi:sialate O-acetylesterase